MSLPEGWKLLALADICMQDRRIVEPGSNAAETLPYLGLEDIESETGRIRWASLDGRTEQVKSSTFAFDERHILYGKLRPYLNKVALPTFAGRCTTELI